MDYRRVGHMGCTGAANNSDLMKMKMKNYGTPVRSDTGTEKTLAMMYAPYQNFEDIYPIEKALCVGTIFAQLDLPCVCCTANRARRG